MPRHRIFGTSFASIYPHYVAKAERKNHSKEEVDQVITLAHRLRRRRPRSGHCR